MEDFLGLPCSGFSFAPHRTWGLRVLGSRVFLGFGVPKFKGFKVLGLEEFVG